MNISYDFLFQSSLEQFIQKISDEKDVWIDWEFDGVENDPILNVLVTNNIIKQQKEKLVWLLQQGFNPNKPDSNNWSILIHPTHDRNFEAIQILLDYGTKTAPHEKPVGLEDFPLFVLVHYYSEKEDNDRFTNLFHQYMKTGSVLFYRNNENHFNIFRYIAKEHMLYFLTLLEPYQDKMDDVTLKQYKANKLKQILV